MNSLPEHIRAQILELAEKRRIQDLVLFHPAAADPDTPRGPIHLAARGGNVVMFALEADDPTKVRTLRRIQVTNLDRPVPQDIMAAIQKQGVILRGRL